VSVRRWYVYKLQDADDAFYIGKGTGDRARQHLRPSYWRLRKRLYRHIATLCKAGHPPTAVRIMEELSEDVAFQWERFFILALGRKGCRYNPGPLLNDTDGGDGLDSRSACEHEKKREANRTRKIRAGLAPRKYSGGPQRGRKNKGTRWIGKLCYAEIRCIATFGKLIRSRGFKTEEEAAHARDELTLQYQGPDAYLNFPNEIEIPT